MSSLDRRSFLETTAAGVPSIYSSGRVGGLGVQQVLTAPRSVWQSPYVERLIGVAFAANVSTT